MSSKKNRALKRKRAEYEKKRQAAGPTAAVPAASDAYENNSALTHPDPKDAMPVSAVNTENAVKDQDTPVNDNPDSVANPENAADSKASLTGDLDYFLFRNMPIVREFGTFWYRVTPVQDDAAEFRAEGFGASISARLLPERGSVSFALNGTPQDRLAWAILRSGAMDMIEDDFSCFDQCSDQVIGLFRTAMERVADGKVKKEEEKEEKKEEPVSVQASEPVKKAAEAPARPVRKADISPEYADIRGTRQNYSIDVLDEEGQPFIYIYCSKNDAGGNQVVVELPDPSDRKIMDKADVFVNRHLTDMLMTLKSMGITRQEGVGIATIIGSFARLKSLEKYPDKKEEAFRFFTSKEGLEDIIKRSFTPS